MTSQIQVGTTASTLGLSTSEAEAARRRGEGNVSVTGTSRTYVRILRTNVFNFYNSILFIIGGALLALGRYNDALISVGLGVLNAAISAVQEIRAKRQLDRLQLLARGTVVVVRDGRDTDVVPEAVVRGDVVRVRPGDQVVVDGPLVEGAVEVDESLLTGEADAQRRSPGEDLLSGSHCVGGAGLQQARDVGAASYANRLTAEARRASTDTTPLQRRIAFVIRLDHAARRPDERGDPAAGGPRGLHRCCGSCRPPRCCRAWSPTACSSSSRWPTPPARSPARARVRSCSGSTPWSR